MTSKSSQSLKVGLVFDDSLDAPDGVQQYILTLGNWLASEGHEVHYLVGQTARTDIANLHSLSRNMKVKFNGNRLSIPLPTSKKVLRKLLAEQQFDILHVQTPYSPMMAGPLILAADRQTAIVGTFHILPYSRVLVWANKALALLNHRTAKRFTIMIANSQPSKAFADKVYGFQSVVIPNPFPLAQFATPALPTIIPKIVFLGRLVERKGARQLVEAVAYLKEHHLYTEDFQVLIGGKGEQLNALKQFVAEHKLTSTIFFKGFIAEADKKVFLAQADIAAFPSVSGESFGISLLEAMAAARGVVIGGDNPGYRSVLAPLSEEQFVQPNNIEDFAHQLAYWLLSAEARSRASSAQKTYVRRFDITIVGPQVVQIYTQALRQKRNVR